LVIVKFVSLTPEPGRPGVLVVLNTMLIVKGVVRSIAQIVSKGLLLGAACGPEDQNCPGALKVASAAFTVIETKSARLASIPMIVFFMIIPEIYSSEPL